MKIGIVSDTHRNKDYLFKVGQWLTTRQKAATIYHLGDDYEDVSCLAELYVDIVQVPGVYDPRYLDGSLLATQMETVLGLQILLVHALEKDATEADLTTADIILHGHTHRAEISFENGHLFLNPGHLKGDKDKNMLPSFGMLDIQDRTVSAMIYDLNFEPIYRMELGRGEGRLIKMA